MQKNNKHIFNIYCDESCHLEHDNHLAMTMGAVWCPLDKAKEIFIDIREIKERHGLKRNFEVKWTKVSPAKQAFYQELLEYFFQNENLHFRCLVVPDKNKIDHGRFNQDHDTWYYKIYFDLLKVIFNPDHNYRIYLDIKDTNGGEKIKKLHEVLCNKEYDFNRERIEWLQIVKSDEVELIQLADFLTGIISYNSRGLNTSATKNLLVKITKELTGYQLDKNTLLKEDKFNIFIWSAS